MVMAGCQRNAILGPDGIGESLYASHHRWCPNPSIFQAFCQDWREQKRRPRHRAIHFLDYQSFIHPAPKTSFSGFPGLAAAFGDVDPNPVAVNDNVPETIDLTSASTTRIIVYHIHRQKGFHLARSVQQHVDLADRNTSPLDVSLDVKTSILLQGHYLFSLQIRAITPSAVGSRYSDPFP